MEHTREARAQLTLSVIFGAAATVFGFLKSFDTPNETRAIVCALSVMSLTFCFFTLLCQHLIESAEESAGESAEASAEESAEASAEESAEASAEESAEASAAREGGVGEVLRKRLHHIAGLIKRGAALHGIFFIGVSLYVFLDWERGPIGLFWRHSSMWALACGVGQLITLVRGSLILSPAQRATPST